MTGIGSGLITYLFQMNSDNPVIGASGAVYGILLAFGMMFPNRTVYIYFLLPIKVKYLVMILVATEFILSMNSTSDISHITHLSAVLIGYIYLRYFWRIKDIKFSSPILTASGTYGYGYEVENLADVNKWGGLITKSVTLNPREGNPPPRIAETSSGMLNSIGLANLGVRQYCKDVSQRSGCFRKRTRFA